ncbi:MAG: hypothetical protein FWC97_09440 [Treponema sp.]|nr:hypothetical protein [Treponema sp.]
MAFPQYICEAKPNIIANTQTAVNNTLDKLVRNGIAGGGGWQEKHLRRSPL